MFKLFFNSSGLKVSQGLLLLLTVAGMVHEQVECQAVAIAANNWLRRLAVASLWEDKLSEREREIDR